MADYPSFKGFRSPDGTRESRIALFRDHLQKANASGTTDRIDWQASIDRMEGELGKAWDCVAERLGELVSDAEIAKNPTAVELLLIFRSVALSVCGSEDIDGLMDQFVPIFNSQRAWMNSINSRPDPRAEWWVVEQWHNREDKDQSKRAFAREYRVLVKRKFDLLVTEETIYRNWLPRTK